VRVRPPSILFATEPDPARNREQNGEMSDAPGMDPADALSEQERRFIWDALSHYGGPADPEKLPLSALGFADGHEFGREMRRLADAVLRQAPLTELDLARVLFFTELSFGSDVLGAGYEFALTSVLGFSDAEGIVLLRGIQRKLMFAGTWDLVFPNL
jgi:hypothetical protein